MDKIEQQADGNYIRISIKRPEGLRRKWSESSCNLRCGECGTENVSTDISGELFLVACLECPNWQESSARRVFNYYDSTEEAYINVPDKFEKIRDKKD